VLHLRAHVHAGAQAAGGAEAVRIFVEWKGSKLEPFIRTALTLIPSSVGASVEITQDPELGYLVPVVRFRTCASLEDVIAAEDLVHEALLRSPVYYIFNEIAVAYEFSHDLPEVR
jgi:hypothetical protein